LRFYEKRFGAERRGEKMRQRKKIKARDYKIDESGVYLSREAADRRRNKHLQDIFRIPVVSADEERELARRYKQEGDIAAGNKLAEAHLRLVPRIARRVAEKFGYRPSKDDPKEAWDGYWNLCRELELAGNEGLLKARDRFDPSRGASFATCAQYSISKACMEEAKRLRSPVGCAKRQAAISSVSLNERIFDDSDETRLDRKSAEPTPTPSLGDIFDLRAMLEAKVDSLLDPRERQIIRARWLTDKPEKLKQLGAELGMTTGRVHQLEKRAIDKLQKPMDTFEAACVEDLAQLYAMSPLSDLDEWLDVLKKAHPSATAPDRREAHQRADVIRAEASDYNLNRVKAALDEGLTVREVAAQLDLPLDEVERFRQLVDWRYGEETRYTLTDKALALLAYRGEGKVA
jgi:RNA polymerase sigma-32 factor